LSGEIEWIKVLTGVRYRASLLLQDDPDKRMFTEFSTATGSGDA
jgi:hypothetical protein